MTFSVSSLRVRLMLLVLVAVIPALALIIFTHLEQRRLAIKTAEDEALRVAQLVAEEHSDLIEGARQLLLTLSQVPQVRSKQGRQCAAFLGNLLKQYRRYSNLGLVDAGGEVICSARPFISPLNLSDRAWYQRSLASDDFAIGDYVIDRISKKATVSFSYPLLGPAGRATGVLFAALDLAWLNQIAARTKLPASAILTLADQNGTILAQHPEPEKWVGKPVHEVLRINFFGKNAPGLAQAGLAETNAADGRPYLIGFTSVKGPLEGNVYVAVGFSKQAAFAGINRILARNLVWFGMVSLLALLAAWFGSNFFVLRQIHALLGMSRRLAEGDFSARTRLSQGRGELDQLAASFDRMAASLEEAKQTQADFSAMIIHDLRSPLAVVISSASVLKEDPENQVTEGQKKWVDTIQANAEKMLNLVNQFLDFSKIEAGKMELKKEKVDLVQMIRSRVDDYSILGRKKRLIFALSVPQDSAPTRADPRRLEQVFDNLLSNAVKFTPQDGRIEVGMASDPGGIRIWVKNSGDGIDPKELPYIFEKYRQTETGRSTKQPGTGLGLAISKMIVEAHRGKIWAESEPGRGVTVFFSLPVQT